MDAVALTVLVDRDGAGSGKILASRLSEFRIDSASDFDAFRRLVVEPTMEAVVAVRTDANRRMDQLSHTRETI